MNEKNLSSIVASLNAFSPYPITVREYDPRYKIENTGWGCWYFEVGVDHPLYIAYGEDSYSRHVAGHAVTYACHGKIGFDLGHSWCNPSHDLSYLRNQIALCIADLKRIDSERE